MRLVVGITGGSGIPYAVDLLQTLRALEIETHLVISKGAARVYTTEGRGQLADLEALGSTLHSDADLGASIASGSFRTSGMIIVPCSSSTLAKVALGLGDTLITRAAHVTLKERRPLVLVPREAPYPRPMLENMLRAFDAGATVLPASPGFYHTPERVSDLLGFVTARVLDQFGIESGRMRRWEGSR
ncbi:4-hydroxy-3-polyprenylbenzoate decarboxylase [Deinobacterium chartae]|uniref:Flavin prenyltransferase UbiX n=1 Tax=Deinobacterium chartae TaxID=521158 RepID=A0A841I3G9_9DEIO|nr:UbiX family flavin prenyltransferase [Deinobacterium chartae]MBB6098572.1 4-hydroxy-3-polyprenylbenzoate decarboxylase [Deinobacterium chartae]